ncbi:MAG: peroxiredoxin [Chitinivibrionales bacterium]
MKRNNFKLLLILLITTICWGEDGMLSVGDAAPGFSLRSHNGKAINLEDYKGQKYVVLIFYPGDQTPGCTQQLCAIRDDYSAFQKRDAVVFGVNPGSAESHRQFAEKQNYQFPLLVDEKGKVAKEYRAYGLFFNKRTVYVIDKEGKIIYAKRGNPPISDILAGISE